MMASLPENMTSIDCPNARLPMSCVQPQKSNLPLGALGYIATHASTGRCGPAQVLEFGCVVRNGSRATKLTLSARDRSYPDCRHAKRHGFLLQWATDIVWRNAPTLVRRFGTEHVIRCQ